MKPKRCARRSLFRIIGMLQKLPRGLGNHLPLAHKKGLQKPLVSGDERRIGRLHRRLKGGRLSLDHPSMRRQLWTLAHLDLFQAAAFFIRFCFPDAACHQEVISQHCSKDVLLHYPLSSNRHAARRR
jgi:hypothetical protein